MLDVPTCPCCGAPVVGKSDPKLVPDFVALTAHEHRLYEYLAAHFGQWQDNWHLVDALYADDPDGGPLTAEKSVKVFCYRLNLKIKRFGLVIDGAPAHGRRLVWSEERLVTNSDSRGARAGRAYRERARQAKNHVKVEVERSPLQ